MSSRKIKKQGRDSEKRVSVTLRSLGSEYIVFDNLLLETAGGTTQIDHVVVSPYGVFVIETKSHKGMIYGDCSSKNWTQVLIKQSIVRRYSFYSPYLQNYGHLKALYKLLEMSDRFFSGVVVFTGNADLSNVNCPNVVYIDLLPNIISQYRTQILNSNDINYICSKLNELNKQSKYRDSKHVKYVEELVKNNGVLKGRKKK